MGSEWDIRLEDLTPAQRQVADIIGLDNYVKLIDAYGSEPIYIPKRDNFERIARNQRILNDFDGYNFNLLARKYSLTSVTIRHIVEDKKREIRAAPISGQTSMFDYENGA